MPPTIQSGRRPDEREKRQRPGDKRSDLVCRVKYNNTLPDIPFDPKFITYPFESNRFYQYKPTSLERSFKYDLLTEHDLDVTIDLINPDTYKIDPNAYPDAEDEKLLEDELNTPSDSKRSRHHNTNVSWLRKTEYISTEYNRFMQKSDKSESKVGFKIKQQMREEDLYKDRDSQITAIQATFDRAKDPITKHYSKPGVTPVEVLPVYPDFKLWKLPFAQVLFDSDPAADRVSKDIHVQAEEMSQAMIRGAVDESGEQFVAYFLPTEETMGKRKADFEETVDYTPDQVYEYLLAREYNWNVKNKLSKGYEETYFFVFREDGVFYNELETRVRLSKRRKVGSQRMPKSWLEVKHRELNSKEEQAQEVRMSMLEPPQEEEEEEEMQVDEGEKASDQEFKSGSEKGSDAEDNKSDAGSVKSGGSARSRSRSRSKSRSKSRSVSRSKSRSRSRSRSRSKSGSRSRSRSRSGSRSPSRSRSRSKSKSKSRSRSRSRSGSRSASSGSEKGSEKGSDVESEAEKEKEKEEERAIFGSDSDSSDNE